ncbi:hypothetical protein CBF34_00310 [Vagococcus penaei]|uniref:Uncharacterized protein n=1 Tax=Vagococcus penaei TaxID=633807 RepID=A0A1Q2D595_9ENTE|nr:ankyrin repeat domain-containing protein [Vagococcus penaei]AQP53544.1 hypothetical protein BW732_04390 [Vagococcus penaei]RSU07487.1 hypothetical protein CBF34_00310 [Vagococcus penaei]
MVEKKLVEFLENGELTKFLAQVTPSTKEVTNHKGQSALMLVVLANDLAKVAQLLSLGLDANHQDNGELSPFIAAAANGFSDIFSLMVTYQPDLTQVNRFGGTALLPSSEKGFIEVVQTALEAGVPVNHVNRLGWTAIQEAVILGDGGYLYQDIIEELSHYGATYHHQDYTKRTVVDYALLLKQLEVYDGLMALTPETQWTLVKQLLRQKKYRDALHVVSSLPDSLKKRYYLGRIYEQLKEYDLAKDYYEQGLQEAVQFAFYLALLMRKQGAVEPALAYFDLGIEQTDSDFFSYHKANYLRDLGRHQEAIILMEQLLEKQPKRVDYLFHLANSLSQLGQFEAARTTLLKAAILQPDNPLFVEQVKNIDARDKLVSK